jgi:poly [ADP-ribose] polymerase
MLDYYLDTNDMCNPLRSLRVPIVKEEFLEECMKEGVLVPVNQYMLETAGKFSSIMKVKVKGRSAVHEESGLQDVGHILEVGKTIFNTTLNLSDLSTGINR